MKKIYGVVFIISILLSACAQTRTIESSYINDSPNDITYQQFYDDLSPYGQWINSPEFGYVWAPREAGFRPYYSNGRWAYTSYGWTWVSDYNWGWATFHYGRWFYDSFYGWTWVPGYEWAPAWVSWRQNSNYYGWAPLCPQRRNGSYYEIRNDQWAFVPQQYINKSNLNNYYINNQNNTTIINNTTVINNTRVIRNGAQYQEGPHVTEVEKVTNTRIKPLAIKQSSVPGEKLQNNALQIYKPVVKRNAINANVNEGKTLPAGNITPVDKRPRVTNNAGIIRSQNKADENLNKTTEPASAAKEYPVKNNENVENNPATNNDNQMINSNDNQTINPSDVRKKRLQDFQQQRDINRQQNRVTRIPDNNNEKPVNQENINNNPQPQRTIERPAQRRINREERIVNNQQNQNPGINQRSSRVPENSGSERPVNSYERRPQVVPQSPPANPNSGNNAGRKIRNF